MAAAGHIPAMLCVLCIEIVDGPFTRPTHVVHPEHRKPDTWDVRGEADCPHCGVRWRRTLRNTFELVTRPS